ncbi:hypothetical protein AMECASPLE_027113 [Ameca splendens]|uniref:Uncharacterized protein n=1 Tax=Ameca splendens TaxID=208324 RepID=A0ABV0YTA2_9TELE
MTGRRRDDLQLLLGCQLIGKHESVEQDGWRIKILPLPAFAGEKNPSKRLLAWSELIATSDFICSCCLPGLSVCCCNRKPIQSLGCDRGRDPGLAEREIRRR